MKPKEFAETNLLTAILKGTFAAGTSLPNERLLAKELGVTRPTLREILQRLEKEGWITIRHGKSTVVNDYWQQGGLGMLATMARFDEFLPQGFISNLLEVRLSMLPGCAAVAIKKVPELFSAHLARSTELGDDPARFVPYDWELQVLMVRYCDNLIYPLILNDFFEIYKRLGSVYFGFERARQLAIKYYRDLADDIQAGGDRAAEIVHAVLQQSIVIWQEIKAFQKELGQAQDRVKARPRPFSGPTALERIAAINFAELPKNWDLIVIGGGITGAGVFREAVRMGLKVLLLEQKDFAWGTSSRSSKMVHGGLRYLKEGKFILTRTAVKERERLLKDAPGLVESSEFLMPVYNDHGPSRRALELGLSIYDLMAHDKQHSYLEGKAFLKLEPAINPQNLIGGFQFIDAQVDDSRLVLRLLFEGIANGGYALNYTPVSEILHNRKGEVVGVSALSVDAVAAKAFYARAVINATGAWAEKFHPSPKAGLHIRPLRGSHMVFPREVLPLARPVSFFSPIDGRPIVAAPWEGTILVGTTDLDHTAGLSKEPAITREEVKYLIQGLKSCFPALNIMARDAIATFAGIRPVLSEGKVDPSKESRENIVWIDRGLVTVTGGKLTTFRKMAIDTLKAAKPFITTDFKAGRKMPVFSPVALDFPPPGKLSSVQWRRLCGRYGAGAHELVRASALEDLTLIPGSLTLWAEIPFAAKYEQVRHLADLLLRRVRVGLLLPEGGKAHLKRIEELCTPCLAWDRTRWAQEKKDYLKLWQQSYSVPDRG